jgi:hypothetical protein
MTTVKYIEKQHEDASGMVFSCWAPVSTQLSPIDQKATINFAGWKDVASMLARKKPTNTFVFIEISFLDLGLLEATPQGVPALVVIQNAVFTKALLDEFFEGCEVVSVEV